MSNGVEKYQPPEIAELDQWAKRLYESGMFKDVRDVAEAFVKVTAGAEMGLSPSQSMRGVHVIQGKTIIGAGLLASLLDRPPYDFKTSYSPNIENPTSCTITVFKNGVERGKSHFSLDDARRAGLLKGGGNWEKYPSDMLFARAISQAARRYAAGALGGTIYVEDHGESEITRDVPEDVTVKPRTRVTAEVIPDPVEHVEGEVVDDAPMPLRAQLTHMSAQEKADLWKFAGLPTGTKMPDVRSRLLAYADELGVEFTEEPNARLILDAARADAKASLPDDAVEEFDHFAQTGQDLSEDPQTAIA